MESSRDARPPDCLDGVLVRLDAQTSANGPGKPDAPHLAQLEDFGREIPNSVSVSHQCSAAQSTSDGLASVGPLPKPEVTLPPAQASRVQPKATDKSTRVKSRRRNEAVTQSFMLLATMTLMLLAARFAVPQIVEEIRYSWHRGELRAEYDAGTEGLKSVSLDALSDAYQMVTGIVGPSVVHIDIKRPVSAHEADVARLLAADPMPLSDQGSGVVVDQEGYVLTNRHVIADGNEITVTLSDGRRVDATVVGTDAPTDLALLKISADRLIPIAWGDSDRSRVGSPVWAIGSPFGLDRTVTFGILSGKHRMVRASTRYQDFMQSDVAVNPGNSGGPLVDSRGMLIGINTAIVGDTYQGVSFSIPSNVARQVYESLKVNGRVDRAFVGISLAEVPDELLQGDDARTRGALVVGLQDSTCPAALAGIQNGDIILEMEEEPIRDMGHLMRKIADSAAGSTVQLKVHREGKSVQIPVSLGQRPAELEF
jgi:serine protease Do